ncbi:unnamed protein product [Lupinus luteus]|uniref:Uncharacterized protein n=1 Tax=Lupinus luteus TaxID=3873 RepID=A0AAV1XPC9_LUPLU
MDTHESQPLYLEIQESSLKLTQDSIKALISFNISKFAKIDHMYLIIISFHVTRMPHKSIHGQSSVGGMMSHASKSVGFFRNSWNRLAEYDVGELSQVGDGGL